MASINFINDCGIFIKSVQDNSDIKIEKENLDGVFEYYVIPGNWKFITTYLSDTFEYGPYEKKLKGKTDFVGFFVLTKYFNVLNLTRIFILRGSY